MLLQNILGDIRAESDIKMLDDVFFETPEYKGIIETRDFNFVVGRRGSGKSAIKYHALKQLGRDKSNWTFDIASSESSILAIQGSLQQISNDYRELTAIMKVVIKIAVLFEILVEISRYYKKNRSPYHQELDDIYKIHKSIISQNFYTRCYKILQSCSSFYKTPKQLPFELSQLYNITELESVTSGTIQELKLKVILFFDNLDEGWVADIAETAIVGGLAQVASYFKDSKPFIHFYIFARDNMFRALAALDNDFTRNIEGATVRLKWDNNSLFFLITERIKVAFELRLENNTKVWNRVAKTELAERRGFEICTSKTLYRPRDIISLLNSAFSLAAKDNREAIILQDIENSSQEISEFRLKDLSKEYDLVFPSLDKLILSFHSNQVPSTFSSLLEHIELFLDGVDNSESSIAKDFSILNSKESCALALYSIGFIGIDSLNNGKIHFCHDGASSAKFETIHHGANIWIHPCYWSALNIQSEAGIIIATSIYDDCESNEIRTQMKDLRMKQIGGAITEIDQIPDGREGAKQYEDWVLRVTKILFSQSINNLELHPNGNGTNRRDIVGTITAPKGFWQRINNDYNTRQIIFEAKNYEDLKLEDFRQMVSYLTGTYGDFGILVPRREFEAPRSQEIEWIKTCWLENKKMIFIISSETLKLFVRK